tara:strand:- start:1377 stop:1652 length:276 start_codon:yes stop_codon:yes gene_type:complete
MKNYKKIFYPLFLLFIPLFANIFSEEIHWGLFDFLIMGTLILITSISIKIVNLKVSSVKSRSIIILIILMIFLLTWAELGVGIFGTPFAGD